MHEQPTNRETTLLEKLLSHSPIWLLGAVDTKEASEITRVPAATLVTLRCVGGGPRFFQPTPRSIRYLRIDLYDWMLEGGLKTNTADTGTRVNLSSILQEGEEHD